MDDDVVCLFFCIVYADFVEVPYDLVIFFPFVFSELSVVYVLTYLFTAVRLFSALRQW